MRRLILPCLIIGTSAAGASANMAPPFDDRFVPLTRPVITIVTTTSGPAVTIEPTTTKTVVVTTFVSTSTAPASQKAPSTATAPAVVPVPAKSGMNTNSPYIYAGVGAALALCTIGLLASRRSR